MQNLESPSRDFITDDSIGLQTPTVMETYLLQLKTRCVRIWVFRSVLEMAQNVHGCLLAPEGAVEALLMIFSITSFGTGLSENSLTERL